MEAESRVSLRYEKIQCVSLQNSQKIQVLWLFGLLRGGWMDGWIEMDRDGYIEMDGWIAMDGWIETDGWIDSGPNRFGLSRSYQWYHRVPVVSSASQTGRK